MGNVYNTQKSFWLFAAECSSMTARKESSFYKEKMCYLNIFLFKVLVIETSILVKKGKFGLRGKENEINMLCHHCLPSFSKKLMSFKVFNRPWISTMALHEQIKTEHL